MKHMLQFATDIYSGEAEFIELMLDCGFQNDLERKTIFFVTVNPELLHGYYGDYRQRQKYLQEVRA